MTDEGEQYGAGCLDPRAILHADEEIDMASFELRKDTPRKIVLVGQNRPTDRSIAICLHTEVEAEQFGQALIHHKYCRDLKMMVLFPIRPPRYVLNIVGCNAQYKLRHQPKPWLRVNDSKWIFTNVLSFLAKSDTLLSVTLSFERVSHHCPMLLNSFSKATCRNAKIRVVNILRGCGTSRIIRRIRRGRSVSEVNLVDVYSYDADYWKDRTPIVNFLGQCRPYPATFRSCDMRISFGRKTRSIRSVLIRLVEYNCLKCFYRFLGMFTPFEQSVIKRFKSDLIRVAVDIHQRIRGFSYWTEYDTVFYLLLTHKMACKDDPAFEKRIRLMKGNELETDTSQPGRQEMRADGGIPQESARHSVPVLESQKKNIKAKSSSLQVESQTKVEAKNVDTE